MLLIISPVKTSYVQSPKCSKIYFVWFDTFPVTRYFLYAICPFKECCHDTSKTYRKCCHVTEIIHVTRFSLQMIKKKVDMSNSLSCYTHLQNVTTLKVFFLIPLKILLDYHYVTIFLSFMHWYSVNMAGIHSKLAICLRSVNWYFQSALLPSMLNIQIWSQWCLLKSYEWPITS